MRSGVWWKKPAGQAVWALGLSVVAAGLWAAWLGWDQHKDVGPDGTVSGPYEVWQVAGLVLSLLVVVCWAALRRHTVATVAGTTIGLTLAAWYDWSDDSSGLFAVGVAMVMFGSVGATGLVCALVRAVKPEAGRAGRWSGR
ncbi:hypothetical protein GTY81_35165 [Streptomyces sp. SID8366]|uniref:hypothetical protein n=1 Tax=unclassified Streptomyces TaxID=2593676 RepID=UPI000DBAAB1F|nr:MULTISPECIES: hypothetical protein [unclassified Streptomyces]MYU09019.1 hypothetical protein [Streptomyces sp. SID8366]MYU67959.1 hypothetical protein [Streptomyces sp. SID69]RAJ52530.1 hypothetical protein K376_05986 [Streptomyces sp. PsTaAH-130]